MKNLLKNSDPNQRRAANNIFIFLAAMLVFTLIARGTNGATLARVTVSMPARGEIIESINGTATVFSTDIIDVTVIEGLTINEMFINEGQELLVGDAIAEFCLEELLEKRARENARLEQMHLELERLERTEPVDTSSVDNARRTLNRANEDYVSAVEEDEKDINTARENLESLLDEYENNSTALRTYARALEDFLATEEQGREDIASAQETLYELLLEPPDESEDNALQSAIRNHARALDDYNTVVEQGEEDIAEAQEALTEARRNSSADRTALDNARRTYDRAKEDYDTARERGQANVDTAERVLLNAIRVRNDALAADPPDEAAIASAMAEVEKARAAVDTAQTAMDDNLATITRRLEDAETSLNQARQNFNNSRENEIEKLENALETAQSRATDNRLTAARRLEDTEVNLAQAQQNFANNREKEIELAQTALEAAETRASDNLSTATRRLEDASHSVSTEVENAQKALQTAIDRARDNRQTGSRRVEDARASLASAEFTHQRNVQQNADTVAQNRINSVTLTLDIAAQQDVVDTLDNLILANGILYSEEVGVVATAMTRNSVIGKTPIITIRDTEGGFEAQMQILRTEAEQLSVGSESEVTTGGGNMFFTPTTTGIVSAISAPDDNDRVTISIALPESNWNAGQRIDAQIVLNRGSYDMSVPISALRSDNFGYFVYVVGQRNTVLGLQNVVERVNVNVLASDNDTVSVTGVSRACQVISASNRAVNVGDRVRVNE